MSDDNQTAEEAMDALSEMVLAEGRSPNIEAKRIAREWQAKRKETKLPEVEQFYATCKDCRGVAAIPKGGKYGMFCDYHRGRIRSFPVSRDDLTNIRPIIPEKGRDA